MIVRNEAAVIRRCLDSVLPLIDYALLVDTGSDDGTPDVVKAWLQEHALPGEVRERPWVDFAHNRTEAAAALREVDWIDYALTIDADEVLVFEPGFSPGEFKSALTEDVYDVTTRSGAIVYQRPQLFSNRLAFRYRSVLHEYLEAPGKITRAAANGFHDVPSRDGARSRNPQKYARDAALLREALESETDPFLRSRYRFYLAQSLRDAGQYEEALVQYLARAELGFWVEEVFMSLYQAGRMSERLKRPFAETLEMYQRAHDTLPTRAEALQAAARICRKAGRYELAYYFARKCLEIAPPSTALFLDVSTYEYGVLRELQIAAYRTGRFAESVEAGEKLVLEAKFPERYRERIGSLIERARLKSAAG
ncbi:glycosyltransferase family 2 protein [Devosia sp.]|uniref:glycosyltransferase family 2 protein n=1 Tax=Devosia sp. TaxID=1871048 RepID=UPI002EE0B55A